MPPKPYRTLASSSPGSVGTVVERCLLLGTNLLILDKQFSSFLFSFSGCVNVDEEAYNI